MNNTTLVKKLKTLAVPKNSSLPSLSNVLISCEEDTISFYGTDLDTFTSFSIALDKPYGDFTSIINHKELISILASLPKNTEVDFTMNEKFCITSEFGTFKMSSVSTDSYPSLPVIPENLTPVNYSIINMLAEVSMFCAGKNEMREALTGIFYDKENNSIVGTDGHYMGVLKNIENLNSDSFILPSFAVKPLVKALKASNFYGKNSEINAIEIGIDTDRKYISFVAEDFTVTAKIIEGDYPPYHKVIPTGLDEVMELDVDKINLIPFNVLNKATHQIMLRSYGGNIILHGENGYTDTVWEMEAGVTTYSENIAFNAKLLQNICKFIGKNPAIIGIKDNATAVLYEDADRLALLMPVRLPDSI